VQGRVMYIYKYIGKDLKRKNGRNIKGKNIFAETLSI